MLQQTKKCKKGPNENPKTNVDVRRAVFKKLLSHLRQGYSIDSFEMLAPQAIQEYIKEFPDEFIASEIERATRAGKNEWESIGKRQATGDCLGNSRSWYYNMANRYGWREKVDIEADHKGSVSINVVSYASSKEADSKPKP